MPSPVLPYGFRNLWQPRKGLAIAEASVIGLVAALSAVLLKFGSGALGTWRVHTSYLFPAWIVLPLVGVGFGFLAGWLVERLAPEASGSGIPQVKASLANVPMNLSWRVASVKLLSAIIAIGSGLTLGRQGPTVQVGAGLAAGMSRLVPTSPDHRRQMIAAGAGAGLAAAFNAPIAGVLFIIEELLQDLSGLTLGTAIIASFIGGVVSRLLGGGSLLLNLPETKLSSSFLLTEIPFYLLLGICAGLFAALFNLGLIYSIKLYRRLHVRLPIRIGLAGLTSGIIVALLPESFRDNTGLREFVIATSGNASLAAIAFIAQFFLTLVAFGSGAPGGLFAPSLILGSCLGHIIGIFQESLMHAGSPTTYALAGMGAFFSGVSKVPITAIVIVFEMTTDFNLVLPLMIGSVTSYLVADKLVPGSLYDKLLKLNGIEIQNQASPEGILTKLTAREVMQCRVESFDADMSVEEAMKAFSRSHHRGFPVVDDGRLVGIITQSDLLKIGDSSSQGLDKSEIIKQIVLREIMTSEPVTVTPHHSLSNVLYLLDRYKISRLPVLEGRRLIGIITRADIIRAEAERLNCQNPEKPPTEPSYLVYQTRSPSTGRGRLLLPIANPDTAATLIQMAVAIARERHYEIECVQIMLVPRYSSPSETQVRTTKSRKLLRQAEVLGKKWKIPIHTQIRVAHDVAQAILETISDRHINIMLMGWKGNTDTPGRIFGNVVDTVVRQATCEVMLVKLGTSLKFGEGSIPSVVEASHRVVLPTETVPTNFSPATSLHSSFPNPLFNNWLIPMAGGPNAWLAIKLLPALVTLGEAPKIRLTRVFHPSEIKPDMTVLEEAIRQIIRRRQLYTTVIAEAVKAESVSEGVINLVNKEHYDVIVLGASREGMLQQAIKGNIPEAIASGVESTVILVRGAINPE
jgi:chloride channel protein, CIC family